MLAVLKPKTRFSYRSGSFGRLGYPLWCLRAGSGCRRRPLQGRALPLSYRGIWCERLDSNQCRRDYQSRIPPTELRSHIIKFYKINTLNCWSLHSTAIYLQFYSITSCHRSELIPVDMTLPMTLAYS